MKVKVTNLAPLFNAEIRRVAREENKTDEKSMDAFMEEIALICDLKQKRMVYHWRSGRHRLPAEHVPALCRRFKSNVLLDALTAAAGEIEIAIPDSLDLARQASRSLRQDLEFHERFLKHFEHDGIQPGELDELRELQARAHRNLHLMFGIAEADCQRRLAEAGGLRRKNNITSRRSAVQSNSKGLGTGVARRQAR